MPLLATTHQRRAASSGVSTPASDDEDAITPCALVSTPGAMPESALTASRSRPYPGRCKLDVQTAPGPVDTELLWRRMLAIQRIFGCYKSARMEAALEGHDGCVPSRACLDLLNDSIDQLPEETRRELGIFLEHGLNNKPSRMTRFTLKSWLANNA